MGTKPCIEKGLCLLQDGGIILFAFIYFFVQ